MQKTKMDGTRRSFLKKAAYSAPVIVGLGTLSAPVSAKACHSGFNCGCGNGHNGNGGGNGHHWGWGNGNNHGNHNGWGTGNHHGNGPKRR